MQYGRPTAPGSSTCGDGAVHVDAMTTDVRGDRLRLQHALQLMFYSHEPQTRLVWDVAAYASLPYAAHPSRVGSLVR